MRRLFAGILCVLLLVPTIGSAQLGTTERHVGDGIESAPAYDVIRETAFWGPGDIDFTLNAVFLEWGDEFVAVPETDQGCSLLFFDELVGTNHSRPVEDCPGFDVKSLGAYEDTLILCHGGVALTEPIVTAVDRSGETQWFVTAEEIMEPYGVGDSWRCTHGVIDRNRLVFAIMRQPTELGGGSEGSDHQIVAWDIDAKEIVWRVEVTATDLLAEDAGEDIEGHQVTGGPGYANFEPWTLTATDSGYLLLGHANEAGVLVTMNLDGKFGVLRRAGETALGRPTAGAQVEGTAIDRAEDENLASYRANGWAVGDGSLAYLGFGSQVISFDPEGRRPTDEVTPELPFAFEPHENLGPIVWQDRLAIPIQNGVLLYDSDTMELLWHHRIDADAGYGMWGMTFTGSGDLWVVGRTPASTFEAQLLEGSSGDLLQGLELDFELFLRSGLTRAYMGLSALHEGFMVIDRNGVAVQIGPATGIAELAISDAYPQVGESVILHAPGADVANTTVWWGNGKSTRLDANGNATLTYTDNGVHVVRVTEKFPDGTTQTSTLEIDVGGSPPQELSFLQQAFAPENQDMTWGILGLLLAFFGGIGAYAARAWRRRGIAKYLQQLNQIQAIGMERPLHALGLLRAFRGEVRARAAKGRLDGAQFTSLSTEASHAADRLGVRLVSKFERSMSAPLQHALKVALADGHLSEQERETIRRKLTQEKGLNRHQKQEFADLLADWV